MHGISLAFLADKPKFADAEVCDALPGLHRRGDAGGPQRRLRPRASSTPSWSAPAAPACTEARWVDTLALAQKRFPGMYNSLDALCKRFKISLAEREKHGALIDARLLAGVYLELQGGRERGLDLDRRPRAPAMAGCDRAPRRLRPAPAAAGAALDRGRARRARWPSSAMR